MRFQRALALFPQIVLLSACAKTVWYHQTKTDQQFHADRAECNAMSGSGTSNQIMPTYGGTSFSNSFNQSFNQSQAISSSIAKGGIYDDCMKGKGWTPGPEDGIGRQQNSSGYASKPEGKSREIETAKSDQFAPNRQIALSPEDCLNKLHADPKFLPLDGKMFNISDAQLFQLVAEDPKPKPNEKKLIPELQSRLLGCFKMPDELARISPQAERRMNRFQDDLTVLLVALYKGEIGYGTYSKRSLELADALSNGKAN